MATVPFTPAHAAAALPLWRVTGRRGVLSALVVGSMAPDFEYLVHLRTTRTIGHTVPGLLIMCLPASLLVLAVWHGLLKRPLATLWPGRAGRLAAAAHRPFPWAPGARFLTICLSVLLGAWSHLAWDAFTHRNGVVVGHVGFLTHQVGIGHLHVYNVAQYASGLAGLVLLAVAYRRWAAGGAPAAMPGPALPARVRVTALAAAGLAVASGALVAGARAVAAGAGPRRILTQGVLGSMAAAVVVALVLALLVEATGRARQAE